MFETGTNQWRREDAWPPKDARRRRSICTPDGKLSFDPPTETGAAFDEYVSDPEQARALHRRPGARDDARAHGGRPALRLDAPRRADVPDRRTDRRRRRSPVR